MSARVYGCTRISISIWHTKWPFETWRKHTHTYIHTQESRRTEAGKFQGKIMTSSCRLWSACQCTSCDWVHYVRARSQLACIVLYLKFCSLGWLCSRGRKAGSRARYKIRQSKMPVILSSMRSWPFVAKPWKSRCIVSLAKARKVTAKRDHPMLWSKQESHSGMWTAWRLDIRQLLTVEESHDVPLSLARFQGCWLFPQLIHADGWFRCPKLCSYYVSEQ